MENLLTKDDLKDVMDRYSQQTLQAFKFLQTGRNVKGMLCDNAIPILLSYEEATVLSVGPDSDQREVKENASLAPRNIKTIQQASQDDLDKKFLSYSQAKKQEELLKYAQPSVNIDFEVYEATERWTKDSSSQYLWIEGPHDVEYPSQNTKTSISLILSARTTGIPSIFHFCGEYPVTLSSSDFYSRTTVSLVYGLIAQLWQHVASMRDSKFDRALSRLEGLDGTASSLPLAISLLKDLMIFKPPAMVCVIDCIQSLENPGNRELCDTLGEVIDLFCSFGDQYQMGSKLQYTDEGGNFVREENSNIQRMKTCFTTDGHVNTLGEMASLGKLDKVSYGSETSTSRHREGSELSGLDIK